MGHNLYWRDAPLMINSGTFWRCRHGHTHAIPCWRCGLLHPYRHLRRVLLMASH